MKSINEKIHSKSFKIKGISIVVALMTVLYCFNFSYMKVNAIDAVAYETQEDQELLSEAKAILKKYYIDPVSEEVLASKSISEMISKLNDPYSTYFARKEYDEFVNQIDNRFVGIGINIEVVKEGIKVINVMKASPAEEVGIKTNDIILKANNMSLVGLPAEEAVTYIKGEEGTSVIISIKREDNILEYLVIRKAITMPTVEWEVINDIGYISVNSFGEKTGSDFSDALNKLSLMKVNSYIVDIRNNPGGYIHSALDIGGHFIGNNPMTLIEDNRKNMETYKGYYHGDTIDKPFIFLINEYSASASELLSAAVKDYKKAFFIGKTTYGKGVGQSMYGLSDGGMLKLTTIKFYSPLGNTINHVGVSPDLSVEDDSIDSELVAKLLFSGIGKVKEIEASKNKTGYVKVEIKDNTFYINLNEARKDENWEAYKYIIENVEGRNLFLGDGERWVNTSNESMEDKVNLIYPDNKKLNSISKNKKDRIFNISFNKPIDMNTVNSETIQLIDAETGERIASNITLTDKNKVTLNLKDELEGSSYYLVVSNKVKDEDGSGLAKETVVKIHIASTTGV